VRLLTLTGPGGVGKTRLLLAAAHVLTSVFADGVCFVPLAAISDPDFLLPAIAQALGLRETAARPVFEEVQRALDEQSLLLLLDNFEQVLAAAPRLADLLATCPNLHLLVTSRAALRLHGEHEFAVPPLSLPDLKHLPTSDELAQYAACTLFVQRAQAIKPDFQLTEANARIIAEICVRLDGLPLAIELAAARTRLLSPQALLARLSHRLDVLTGGARNVPARQQTLRSTIAWSYHLLTPSEQQLFRSLAVFAGGCTLEAVEAIATQADTGASSVLDEVSVLLENNLVRQVEQADGESRLLLLETIREYGLECLADTGELEAARAGHAAYYLALAEEAEPRLRGSEQVRWMAQLGMEQENLHSALSFLLEQAHVQAGTPEGQLHAEQALRLCVALSTFWYDHGYGREGLSFLMQALAERAGEGTALRARALDAAAHLAFGYALNMSLEQLAEESLALYQELGDPIGIARSLHRLGIIARLRSQFVLAHARLEEAAARFQELGDRWRQGQCSTERARIAMEQGQFEQARALLEESLVLYQDLGDQQRLGWVRFLLAYLLFVSQQDQPLAQQLAEQSLAHFREQDNILYSSAPLSLLGLIHMERGELEAARALLENSLAIDKQFGTEAEDIHIALGRLLALQGDVAAARHHYQESLTLLFEQNVCKENIAASLEGLAALETGQGAPRHAARLWGAAEALRDAIGALIYPVYLAYLEQAIAQARATLGEQPFRMAWAEGRSMTPQQALAAQEPGTFPAGGSSMPQPLPATTQAPEYPDGLTAREVEVLRLIAQGWTDAQIAEHLVISPRTVNRHTTSLYSKLNVSSRAAATRYAIEHNLL
jgi:predicted ATPase/DNA-binding CsgD family transcriptional regulator